jgi:anti-sigma-K factor RskA
VRRLAPKLAQSLAAEYVVGTLRGRARKRFEAIARADPAVASEVRRWEDELTPLAARVAAVEPPARVWTAIEERIAPRSASPSFWSNLAFWRSFGLVAGGMAGVLIAAFLWLSPSSQGGPEFVAVLTSADAVPRVVVSMHPHHMLRVQTMHPWPKAAGKSLELWAMPKDGPPRSLGLVHNEVSDTLMPMPENDTRMRGALSLVVSLEPPGGSPKPWPTGPVLCSGPIAPMTRT